MITTGSSCIGLKYKDGIIIANDTMICYGNTQKFPHQERCIKIGENSNTLIAASGEMSDFQFLKRLLSDVELEDWQNQDQSFYGPNEISSYLGCILYNRRCKGKPLLNQLIVGGYDKTKKESTLSYIDHQGTKFSEDYITTGFGSHLALPLLRERCEDDKWKSLTEEQAKSLLLECLQVLFYRDCKASRWVQFSVCDNVGRCEVGKAFKMDTFWKHPTWMKTQVELAGEGSAW